MAAERVDEAKVAAAMAQYVETMGRTRPGYMKYFHPRVERSAPLSMYTRAQEDGRPASVAHPTADESHWGSVALPATVRQSYHESASTILFATPTALPDRVIPSGEKRSTFEIERLGTDDYRLRLRTRGKARGPTVHPEAGTLCDCDTVRTLVAKLHVLQPDTVPLVVPRGDAVRVGSPPSRQVRTCFECRSVLLNEWEPIGIQCRRASYSNFCRPRAERVARVNLAARARADRQSALEGHCRPDSIAFLRPREYLEHSTFKSACV